MELKDFDYELPEELIAQTPLERRDGSRMLVLHKESGAVEHKHFYDVIDYLHPGDCLVINDTRVLPARLLGWKEGTGGAMEFVLLNRRENDVWEVMVRPGRKAKVGARFVFGEGLLIGEIVEVMDNGNRLARFTYEGEFYSVLDQVGLMPLPPYIKESLGDRERYQTVYSKDLGSAAAPTAGLHFTQELLQKIEQKGIAIARVTLHVGIGTFRPVKTENILEHHMHSEHYLVTEETAALINARRAAGGRIICVGTTSCRTLETVTTPDGIVHAGQGDTDIFIYPGYTFKALDALITNFHLPQSTLVMLVSAFAGREHVLNAYQIAVQERYRFFSFGDAMFIE